MTQQPFHFAEFTTTHLDGALRLTRQAGWPHRREDLAFLLGLSRGIVAMAAGTVIATGLATPFGPVATANLIIVDQDWRGRGLGRNVMNRVLGLLAPEQWRLVATEDGLSLYESLGFHAVGRVLQHQGELREGAPPATAAAGDAVRWARPGDLDAIARLDAAATGMQRVPLLQRLATQGRLAVLEAAGKVGGYAALRCFGRGEVAGPVIAASRADAEALLSFLFSRSTARFVRVDTTPEAEIADFVAAHGLACVSEGIAMRRGVSPPVSGPFRVCALASQALG